MGFCDMPIIMSYIRLCPSVLTHLAQVNLNDLVVFTAIIWDQVIFELISQRGNL